MKVYVVVEFIAYEYNIPIGVYSSLELAKSNAKYIHFKKSADGTGYEDVFEPVVNWSSGDGFWVDADANGFGKTELQIIEYELDV